MQLQSVALDDKYASTEGHVHITGTQALVRLAMLQSMRDRAEGLNTACYISGYRGSPMHNIDKELWRTERLLSASQINFWPAVNEDLAATAIWGTQQANAFGDGTVDGVFSMWYGKGPGLDRSMDAIRHGHMAGSSQHGGVLVVVGDDHALTSTDAPAAHEYAFAELMMPLLYPAGVQDIVDYGLYGWALSRFCGSWVGFKAIPDTVDASITLRADPSLPQIAIPTDFPMPTGGLNLRIPDVWADQEARHRLHKLDAAVAFARANELNQVVLTSPKPRYGIIASGKAYNDVRQSLRDMGISDRIAADIGITVLKVAMPYPFDRQTVEAFASGLEEVFVVEEKHRMMETAVRDALYSLPDSLRPRVIGQQDDTGAVLLPQWPEITPEDVTKALGKRIAHFHDTPTVRDRLSFIDAKRQQRASRDALSITRQPYFCSGCPHNSSTRVPQGSRALGGVGCHFMSTYMERENVTHTHMGGEGLTWVGQSKFVDTEHVFQNLGDGTYYHSGLLAIRGCIAGDVNITFKILFNDAVAMTGGQPVDGPLSPALISNQVFAEGVRKIFVVSDEPEKYIGVEQFAPGTVVEHRRALDQVQRECRNYKGVSVLIYDQTCAAEKRRRRKKGILEDPSRRVFINDRVCEGCSDCSAKSNCLSVLPIDTAFGRKRMIDQSACNKDYSCAEGFCPSFVSVIGGRPKKAGAGIQPPAHLVALPEPNRPNFDDGNVYSILVTGVGGTGVVTIGALITMAAHLEGQHFSAVDQFGMAQKGGAVTSHIRLAAQPQD
ncbi:MAG: indolepyruvate ferredoxin oxidoreductase family protein, partial [Gammaproteobacteria bacterium]|nr:indolepyruvate ferredoxin oxidoreductase family protein [Gammaproteobacteria bacterium]